MLMPIEPTIWTKEIYQLRVQVTRWFISWHSKKQTTVSKSTCEAEIRALASACQVLWLQNLAKELDPQIVTYPMKPTVIFSDNKAALDWAQTQAYKPKTKHIDVDCKFIREHIEIKDIEVKFLGTEEIKALLRNLLSDSLTKPLFVTKHNYCNEGMGLQKIL